MNSTSYRFSRFGVLLFSSTLGSVAYGWQEPSKTPPTIAEVCCDDPVQSSDPDFAQCCVVGCRECQAHHQEWQGALELLRSRQPAFPSRAIQFFRMQDLNGWTNGVEHCSFDVADDGCCERRTFARSCGEKGTETIEVESLTEAECGNESPSDQPHCQQGFMIASCPSDESVYTIEDTPPAIQVQVRLEDLLELTAERARWEARAEAMQAILDAKVESMEQMLSQQQDSFNKVLELTKRTSQLETQIALLHQPFPDGAFTVQTWVAPRPEGTFVPGRPMTPVSHPRPMPVPFATSAYTPGVYSTPAEEPQPNASQPCCAEGSRCCFDGTTTPATKSTEASPFRSAERLEFSSRKAERK